MISDIVFRSTELDPISGLHLELYGADQVLQQLPDPPPHVDAPEEETMSSRLQMDKRERYKAFSLLPSFLRCYLT